MDNIVSLFFVRTAYAQVPAIPAPVKAFIGKISTEILDPLIAIMFAVATAYFFYGVARYIWSPDNEEEREKGRLSMMYGLIGMFIMVAVFGIMNFIINTIGVQNQGLMNYV